MAVKCRPLFLFSVKTILKYIPFIFLAWSCDSSDPEDEVIAVEEDLSKYINSDGVMMQGFYWDVEPRGAWWTTLEGKIDAWKAAGVNRIWLPPVSKGMSGSSSMGYDPMDYFDFGEYDQMGTVETRFGSRTELESLISKAHNAGIEVIADIVLGHNSGGNLQYNPYRSKDTYTLFQPKSGRFNRTYEDFHPNSLHNNDAQAIFFEEQDLCHLQPNVKKWFWESDSSMAKYYKNTMKFDGWRFDYVKSFDASVIKSWMGAVDGFGVLECWDGDLNVVKSWVDNTGIAAFDFPLFYKLEQAIEGNNMTILKDKYGLWNTYPDKAVTFVNNHDTNKSENAGDKINSYDNRLLAYAYILTHPGYPCIFYNDYEVHLSKTKLNRLIEINRSLAFGSLNILFTDTETYIAQRSGSTQTPGLVIAINNSTVASTKPAYTQWKNATLYDYSGNTNATLKTDGEGRVNLSTPAKSYTVWSLKKF